MRSRFYAKASYFASYKYSVLCISYMSGILVVWVCCSIASNMPNGLQTPGLSYVGTWGMTNRHRHCNHTVVWCLFHFTFFIPPQDIRGSYFPGTRGEGMKSVTCVLKRDCITVWRDHQSPRGQRQGESR